MPTFKWVLFTPCGAATLQARPCSCVADSVIVASIPAVSHLSLGPLQEKQVKSSSHATNSTTKHTTLPAAAVAYAGNVSQEDPAEAMKHMLYCALLQHAAPC